MKLINSFISIRSASLHVLCATCVLSVSSSITSSVHAADPAWWDAKGVTSAGLTANDYAPANLGQLKNFAKQAWLHLDDNLPSGWDSSPLGSVITNQVNSFIVLSPANYTPINVGQMKAVVKPYYAYLIDIGYDTNQNLINRGYPVSWTYDYPWDVNTGNDANYAPANLGQLKMVFSFDLVGFLQEPGSGNDAEGDNIGDDWENLYFGNTTTVNGDPALGPVTDHDGDGLNDYDEYWGGSDPTANDHPDVSLDVFTSLEQ